jgi:SAM-dependent methyltransferase
MRDYYGDGLWYDAEYLGMRGDIPYYAEVARKASGPVLELACGTGRLSIPMAEAGARVVGLDLSEAMLETAEAKRLQCSGEVQDRLRFVAGDMRDFALKERFSAVVLGLNTLMHLTEDDDLIRMFLCVRKHLAEGGRFFFDVSTPIAADEPRDPDARFDPLEMIHPKTKQRYIVSENNVYDPRTQLNTMIFFYQRMNRNGTPVGKEMRATIRLRVFYPRELELFLSLTGFAIEEDWDDLERTQPFSGHRGRRVLVVRPGPPPRVAWPEPSN